MTKDIIRQALTTLDIEELTPLQQKTISLALDRRDVIVLSPTGSGKTLAYLLPLMVFLRESNPNQPTALVLVPSRELALQVNKVFSSLKTGYNSVCCYGGHSLQEEERSLTLGEPKVIIATPGRLLDHLNRGNINTSSLSLLIIDEFDKALELGFQEEMSEIIHLLPALNRRILLSATDADEIPKFTGVGRVVRLDFLEEEEELSTRIELMKVASPQKDKLETLCNLLCCLQGESSIVFCNYRESVNRVTNFLKQKGIEAEGFHGGLEQDQRERNLFKFSNGSSYVLVATDLAARGLDIPHVDHIIHYHLPIDEEAFTHRNGRTARWQASGSSYLILHDEESLPEYIDSQISSYQFHDTIPSPVQSEWTTLYIGKGKKDKLNIIDIVGFMHKTGGLKKGAVGKIEVKEHMAYVAIKRSEVKKLLPRINNKKIKGMKTIFEVAY